MGVIHTGKIGGSISKGIFDSERLKRISQLETMFDMEFRQENLYAVRL